MLIWEVVELIFVFILFQLICFISTKVFYIGLVLINNNISVKYIK